MGSDVDAAFIAPLAGIDATVGASTGAILLIGVIMARMPGPLVEHMQRVRLSVQVVFMSGLPK